MTSIAPSGPVPLRRDGGFTVVELLISVVLLALILATTQSALRFGQRSWEIAEDMDNSDHSNAALKFIEQRLVQAMPLYEREADGRLRVAFSGTAGNVSFIAPTSVGPAGGGLYRFQLGAAPNSSGGQSLSLSWLLYQPSASGGNPDTRILIPEIESFGLRYFGRLKPGEQAGWVLEWSRTDALPDLVEMRFVTRQRHWVTPAVIVAELRLRPPL